MNNKVLTVLKIVTAGSIIALGIAAKNAFYPSLTTSGSCGPDSGKTYCNQGKICTQGDGSQGLCGSMTSDGKCNCEKIMVQVQ